MPNGHDVMTAFHENQSLPLARQVNMSRGRGNEPEVGDGGQPFDGDLVTFEACWFVDRVTSPDY
jgi:hypothetical protein